LSSNGPSLQFQLDNQFGQTVNLADHKGKIVLLTFLYTKCTDICPTVTDNLRDLHQLLGNDAQNVALMVVSVDPKGDTIKSAHDYSQKWNMLDKWDFLVGSSEELSTIWDAYYLDPVEYDSNKDIDQGVIQVDSRGAIDTLQQSVTRRYAVTHSAPVYLLDKKGIARIVFTPPFEPEELVNDLRILME